MSEREAKAAGVPDDQRRRYVRLAWPKVNYGPPVSDIWFSREKGGVLRPAPQIAAAAAAAPAARAGKKKGAGKGGAPAAVAAGAGDGIDAGGDLPMAAILEARAIPAPRKLGDGNDDDNNW